MGLWDDIVNTGKEKSEGALGHGFVARIITDPLDNQTPVSSSQDQGNRFGRALTGGLWQGAGDDTGPLWEQLKHVFSPGGGPDPGAPPKPPTIGETNLIGLRGTLSYEQRLAASSTNFTGGAGLLNDQPATASQVLLGS